MYNTRLLLYSSSLGHKRLFYSKFMRGNALPPCRSFPSHEYDSEKAANVPGTVRFNASLPLSCYFNSYIHTYLSQHNSSNNTPHLSLLTAPSRASFTVPKGSLPSRVEHPCFSFDLLSSVHFFVSFMTYSWNRFVSENRLPFTANLKLKCVLIEFRC